MKIKELKEKLATKKATDEAAKFTILEELQAAKSVKDLQNALVKHFGGE